MSPDPEQTRKLIASLWERSRPVVEGRLQLLARTAAAAAAGPLSPEARHEASAEAHKLTGSLGMFGFPQASVLARELEQYFDSEAPAEAARIASWVSRIRTETGL